MSSSCHMEWKTFMETTWFNDIHSWEKTFFGAATFKGLWDVSFQAVKMFVVSLGLHESSLHF